MGRKSISRSNDSSPRTGTPRPARRLGMLGAALVLWLGLSGGFGGNAAHAAPPPATYPRLLPLQVSTPDQPTASASASNAQNARASTSQTQVTKAGKAAPIISVRLTNPGTEAPHSRLRVILHEKSHRPGAGSHELTPDNVKVEVQEQGAWKPVMLEMVDGGVMGAIGTEGVAAHKERHRRGGFAIPAGFDKTWRLRVTIGHPGTYSVVLAISPDNGSRHLAQPAHHVIEVQ